MNRDPLLHSPGKRLHAHLDAPGQRWNGRFPQEESRNWRFSPADIKGREYWDRYIEAFTSAVRSALQPRFSR